MQNAAGLTHSTTHPPPSVAECKSASATRTHPRGAFRISLAGDVAVLAPKVINRGEVAGRVAILVTAHPQELQPSSFLSLTVDALR